MSVSGGVTCVRRSGLSATESHPNLRLLFFDARYNTVSEFTTQEKISADALRMLVNIDCYLLHHLWKGNTWLTREYRTKTKSVLPIKPFKVRTTFPILAPSASTDVFLK
jgi:hypothetical protein